METFLPCAKHHALTTTTDLFQQFIIAQFSQNFRGAPCYFGIAQSRGVAGLRIFRGTTVVAGGYRCVREQTKTTFKKATRAAAFWRVGSDFRAALTAIK